MLCDKRKKRELRTSLSEASEYFIMYVFQLFAKRAASMEPVTCLGNASE